MTEIVLFVKDTMNKINQILKRHWLAVLFLAVMVTTLIIIIEQKIEMQHLNDEISDLEDVVRNLEDEKEELQNKNEDLEDELGDCK